MTRFARIYGDNKDTLVGCYFIQQVDSKLDAYSKWQHTHTISEKQSAFQATFVENSMKEMQFIK